MNGDSSITTTNDKKNGSTAPDDFLRQVFTDKKAVLIYPDDFIINADTGEVDKNVVVSDLVDRYQGHFSSRRLAVMFRPGTYQDVNFPVGYWTQVLGLGATPDQVKFTGQLGVYCLPANTDNYQVGSLDTFWRSAENFVSDTTFVKSVKEGDGEITWNVPVIDETLSADDKVQASLAPADGKFPKLYPLPTTVDGDPTYEPSKGMLWAVSQAAPVRRVQVADGNLHLSLGNNYASGGYMGNVDVHRNLLFGTQQQFCVRNSNIGSHAVGGAWSMVFNGCENGETVDGEKDDDDDDISWVGTKPQVVWEPATETRIEKPFVFTEDNAVYLGVPKLQADSKGTDYSNFDKYEIDNAGTTARVFRPNDDFNEIQASANKGIKIILSPGIYRWKETLEIRKDDMVVLGLGMAAIQAPGTGGPCIRVSPHAKGVRLSGLSLEASVISKFIYEGSTLLEWGDKDNIGAGSSSNPGAIHDLFCFVGGRSDRTVKVETMVKIFSSHVIGDNLWLWRADHVQLMHNEEPNRPELSEYHVTTYGECECDAGLKVYGDHVTFYGLAVEHTYKDMVEWHGKYGAVYFYQSELPYDVPGDVYNDIAGYRVHVGADHHIAKGIGVYSYFRDYANVIVKTAVATHGLKGLFENVFTVWLNGYSGIQSIINGQGALNREPGHPVDVPKYKGESVFSSRFWQGLPKKLLSSY
eukprot:CAMPEP_0117002990 /NCGR_PEP_ID=MMETSP0472-20121206/4458_1 /TAXON_ID=693140 ORGANISM="Tiarina fusus, Strain LIS" /NCGR_SAMPLE_ID=MMETSP0472 /ASSEMBLY_ACC=CAM_ASM_000603 /LENGTH=694 /DNA_ID=CAMNT_0004703487 /DNA_START=162 /DNA_END=2246 /DNA_ORIENTATION=+